MRRHFITVSAALLFVSALPAAAQSTLASLVGTVADGITAATFGRITRTQSVDQAGPQSFQFSLRYTF